jgi:hypothetical protein
MVKSLLFAVATFLSLVPLAAGAQTAPGGEGQCWACFIYVPPSGIHQGGCAAATKSAAASCTYSCSGGVCSCVPQGTCTVTVTSRDLRLDGTLARSTSVPDHSDAAGAPDLAIASFPWQADEAVVSRRGCGGIALERRYGAAHAEALRRDTRLLAL